RRSGYGGSGNSEAASRSIRTRLEAPVFRDDHQTHVRETATRRRLPIVIPRDAGKVLRDRMPGDAAVVRGYKVEAAQSFVVTCRPANRNDAPGSKSIPGLGKHERHGWRRVIQTRVRPDFEERTVPVFAMIGRVPEGDNKTHSVAAEEWQSAPATIGQLASLALHFFQIKLDLAQVRIDPGRRINRLAHLPRVERFARGNVELDRSSNVVRRND